MSSTRLVRPAKSAETAEPAQADDLNRLRALLLADDRVQLEARNAQLEEALAQAVTKEAFAERLTDELAKALKRAERNDPKAIARAISPAVVQSIRREIVNSREDMVEALYPITGRMVRAAVRDSFSTLIADLNKRLDALTSPALLKAHAKSLIFRKPASTFLIADSRDGLILERGLLIDRQSGSLVHAWQSDASSQRSEESTLVSSMFAAISTFTAENYDGPDAELRTLDLNGRQVALRHSARHVLVVEHTGAINGDAAAHIDTCFELIVERVEDQEALEAVGLLNIEQTSAQAGDKKSNAAKYLFMAVCLLALGLLGWHIWDRVWFAGKADLVTQNVAEQAPLHAPSITALRGDRTITVRGLVPPGFTLQPVAEQLSAAGIKLNNLTQPVAGANDLSEARREAASQLGLLTDELSALQTDIREQYDELATRLTNETAGLGAQIRQQGSAIQTEQLALTTGLDNTNSSIDLLAARLGEQADMLAVQDQLAKQQANETEQLATAIDRQVEALEQQSGAFDQQGNALAELSDSAARTGDQLQDLAAQLRSDLDAQREDIAESQRTIAALQQQLGGLATTQRSIAASEINATRIIFADETTPENPALLDTQIAQLASLAQLYDFDLQVLGYSDQTGSAQINERISLARANAVVEQLVAAGLEPEVLKAQGLGAVADADGVIARQVRLRVVERAR